MKTETIYFFTLDELREDTDMSIDEFIIDICSLRQYWRYKKGESLCPQSRFGLFLQRMKLSMSEFENFFLIRKLMISKILEHYIVTYLTKITMNPLESLVHTRIIDLSTLRIDSSMILVSFYLRINLLI
jgi:hypothetical protein